MIWWILFQATFNRWQIPGILTFPPHVLIVSYTSNSAGFNPSVLGLRLSKPGTWLAEPVLWTSWWHRGSLETESTSGQCGSLGRPSTGSTTQGFFELKRVEVEGIVSLLNIVLIFCWSLFSQKMTRWLDLRFITFSSSTILSCHAFMWRYLFSNHFLNLNGSDVVKSVGGALQQITAGATRIRGGHGRWRCWEVSPEVWQVWFTKSPWSVVGVGGLQLRIKIACHERLSNHNSI